jgi:hypothetical protein
MLKLASVLSVAVITAAWCPFMTAFAAAQQVGAPAAAKQLGAKQTSASSDAEETAAILASDRWRNVEREFSQWLSVQVVYTPEQAEQMKAKLASQIQQMSAAELKSFLDEWDAKLKLLLGKDAVEAREWLAQNLAVMADGYRKQFMQRLGLSDTSSMTAAQIEEAIIRVRAERLSREQESAAFERSRQALVQATQRQHAREQAALEDAARRSPPPANYRGYQSPYSPRRYDYQLPPPRIFSWRLWW